MKVLTVSYGGKPVCKVDKARREELPLCLDDIQVHMHGRRGFLRALVGKGVEIPPDGVWVSYAQVWGCMKDARRTSAQRRVCEVLAAKLRIGQAIAECTENVTRLNRVGAR